MRLEQSLLDLIAIQMGCPHLSDLHFLTGAQRERLAAKLGTLTPREEDLDQWNEALAYLTQAPPQPSAQGAKIRLIQRLLEQAEQFGADQPGERRTIQ